MPRANRHFIPDQIWHLTHRCHDRSFLLESQEDRDRWCYWIRESRDRYGLCVLNYTVTSNHIHLLVDDRGKGEIARAMQLTAGRVGQEHNRRRSRSGPFWQDRYHSTAVESGMHLAGCILYIDMNMVRAGAVDEPAQWQHAGFHEIRRSPSRGGIVDRPRLAYRLGLTRESQLRDIHAAWHDSPLVQRARKRNPAWSNALAIGSPPFVDVFRRQLGARGLRCRVGDMDGASMLYRSRTPPGDSS